MSRRRHRAEDYYARTYLSGRRSRQRRGHAEDYYEQTYRSWRIQEWARKRFAGYGTRPWMVVGDCLIVLVFFSMFVIIVTRLNGTRLAAKTPQSMSRAADTPYRREMIRDQNREIWEYRQKHRDRTLKEAK